MNHHDVVIVGGGVAGLSVARALSRAGGVRVALLEREPILAAHASGKNAAIFRALDGDGAAVALALRSRERFESLEAPEPLLRRTGGVFVGSARKLADLEELARRSSIPVEPVDRHELVSRVPVLSDGDVEAGLFEHGDGVLDIHALCEALARQARAAGASIRTGTAVERISQRRGHVIGVRLADGSQIEAGAVVIAAGAWSGALGARAGADLPIRSLRRHLALLAPTDALRPDAPIVWRVDEEVYFRPESGGILASPCDEEPWPAEDPPASPEALDVLAARLARTAPSLTTTPVRRTWACLRSFVPDRGFVAGEDPRVRGLYWIAALGGHGMTCGVALGELVARGLLGSTADLATISPARLLARD